MKPKNYGARPKIDVSMAYMLKQKITRTEEAYWHIFYLFSKETPASEEKF